MRAHQSIAVCHASLRLMVYHPVLICRLENERVSSDTALTSIQAAITLVRIPNAIASMSVFGVTNPLTRQSTVIIESTEMN